MKTLAMVFVLTFAVLGCRSTSPNASRTLGGGSASYEFNSYLGTFLGNPAITDKANLGCPASELKEARVLFFTTRSKKEFVTFSALQHKDTGCPIYWPWMNDESSDLDDWAYKNKNWKFKEIVLGHLKQEVDADSPYQWQEKKDLVKFLTDLCSYIDKTKCEINPILTRRTWWWSH